jgi:Flp pilus assembly protein TadD
MALNNLGRYKQAISVVNKAIEVNPKDDGVWETKGAALAALGKYREALMCFEESLRLNPNNASAKTAKDQVVDYVQDFWG